MFPAGCTYRTYIFLTGIVGVMMAVGCGTPESNYIPTPATARQSLETALQGWKNGEPRESIKMGEKPVTVIDSRWQNGRKLASFQVNEELTTNNYPSFKVKTQLDQEDSPTETIYLVIGNDPVLIYRSEDYERERSAF